MSQNGNEPKPIESVMRRAGGASAQLQAQVQLQATLLVQRAVHEINDLTNDLHHLTEQASAGNPGARDALRLFFDNLDAARAAARGIAVVRDAPPAGP